MSFDYLKKNDRVIYYDNNDRALYYYLKRVEPSISLCIACGACTATCSAGNFSSLDFHKIMLSIRRGEKVYIAKEITQCVMCGKCMLVCPKNVNTRGIILQIISFLQSYKI
jgi:heterodisulfide reductase subunit C